MGEAGHLHEGMGASAWIVQRSRKVGNSINSRAYLRALGEGSFALQKKPLALKGKRNEGGGGRLESEGKEESKSFKLRLRGDEAQGGVEKEEIRYEN